MKVMDRSVICPPALVEKLMSLGAEKGIPVQRDVLQMGGTDAGPIQSTRSGVYAGGISIPCRYIHTPVEMADQGAIIAVRTVLDFLAAHPELEEVRLICFSPASEAAHHAAFHG